MEAEGLTWRSFADTGPPTRGRIAARWNLASTPTLYVIDHEGVIRRKWVGSPDASTLGAALKEQIRRAAGR